MPGTFQASSIGCYKMCEKILDIYGPALESRKTIWIFDSDANIYSASTFVGSALMGVYALPVLYTTSAFFACVQNRFSESRSDLFPSLLSWQPWVSFDVVSAWRAACERLTHKEVALQAA